MHGRVAVITGAGSGIGRATALAFLEDGYRVALAGRRAEPLAEVAAAAAAPDRALVIPTDVADPATVAALFARVVAEWGRLDVLFNNAGRGSRAVPLDELPFEVWKKVVDVNLTGTFLCTQEAFRIMKRQVPRGGRIIMNGSLSAHVPRPRSAPYTATKHAITGLTKAVALDGRAFDIACGQIDVGNAATEMTARMTEGVPQPDGSVRAEPTMDAAHVARAVLMMANLPLDANIQSLTVLATQMPFVGRG